ncbi:MAG: hypothetical protein K0Q79_2844 [Flavipsychrobacter sp.]|jgi:hypothetical protein|nr:hypothetical protein [Flavipsychrobacter sp.]
MGLMKKLYVLLTGIVAVLFIFPGCSKKDSGPGYYMRAKLGDKDYHVANCIIYASGGATIINGFVQTSTAPVFPYVALSIQSSLVPSKIKLDKAFGNYAYCFTSSGSYIVSESGEVIITDISGGGVSGTFSFKCTDGTTVSGGAFTGKRL